MIPYSDFWVVKNHKEVTQFINKLCVCNTDVIKPEYLVTHDSLLQEALCEYRNLGGSKWWKPTTCKEKSQDQPSIPKAYTVAIEQLVNKALK